MPVVEFFIAKLKYVHSGCDQRLGQLAEIVERGSAVDEHVQPGIGKPLDAGSGDFHRPMQRVTAIAELFDFGRPDRIDQLAEFLQAAERFLQPGEIGRKHLGRIGSDALRTAWSMHVPTSAWVSRAARSCSPGYLAQQSGQIVAQLLALFGKMPIVEHEADEILGHAQAFAGAIGRGIDDAERGE